jgi:hypothetical protein
LSTSTFRLRIAICAFKPRTQETAPDRKLSENPQLTALSRMDRLSPLTTAALARREQTTPQADEGHDFDYLGSIGSSAITGIVFHTSVSDHGVHLIAWIMIGVSLALLLIAVGAPSSAGTRSTNSVDGLPARSAATVRPCGPRPASRSAGDWPRSPRCVR